MEIRIIDLDSHELARKMELGAENAANMTAPMTEIGLDMLRVTESVFHSNGRRGGGSWRRLKPDTVRKKGGSEILRTSGARPGYSDIGNNALYKSVTQLGAPFQILRITNRVIDFGTDRPQAGVQQYGSAKRKIPARPFLRFTTNDTNRWMGMLRNHLMRSFVPEK